MKSPEQLTECDINVTPITPRSGVLGMRCGFTLYEVLMAALVLALGLLGSLALFPKALEVQKVARQRILAASVAYDIVTRHAAGVDHNARIGRDDHALVKSVNNPNLLRLGQRSSGTIDKGDWAFWSWSGSGGNTQGVSIKGSTDVDYRAGAQDSLRDRPFGPVPPEILERLDSDRDELRHLAEEGIGVFYLWPYAVRNDLGSGEELSISDTAAEPLIFAAVGYPQINASFHSPSDFHSYEMIDAGYQAPATPETRWENDHGREYEPTPLSFIWRRKARFLTDLDGSWQAGEPRWRGNHWDAFRWRYWNAFEKSLALNADDNNGAFAFPFKYYLWDYEVQVVDSYYEWEKGARTATLQNHRFRPWQHKTTGVFDHQEDSDTAFPLRPALSNSLYVPFKPSHRCRELVFWSVNWKDYEDAELIDEGLQNDNALHQQGTQGWDGYAKQEKTGQIHQLRFIADGDHIRRDYLSSASPVLGHNSFHPRTWSNAYGNYGALQSYERWFDWHWHIDYAITRRGPHTKPDGTVVTATYRDRNFNEVLDHGPVPSSVRLRAKTIARYVTYDKRLHATY